MSVVRVCLLDDCKRLFMPLVLVLLFAGAAVPLSSNSFFVARETGVAAPSFPDFGELPLSFAPNKGQTNPAVRFISHSSGGVLHFTPSEIVLAIPPARNLGQHAPGASTSLTSPVASSSTIVRLQFIDSSSQPEMQGGTTLPGKVNYLLSNDPTQWQVGLPTYSDITYRSIYPGIDLLYEGTGRHLKGTYTVAPGVDPSLIRWRYDGAAGLTIDEAGNLQIRVAEAASGCDLTLTERAPLAWQEIEGKKILISSRYETASDGGIGFALGSYNRAYPLIIDPTLVYSTYLGGASSDYGRTIAIDGAGNIYVAGETSSVDFPLAAPYQPEVLGGSDVFVTKLNVSGSGLIYSTYLGGNGAYSVGDEVALGIAVDAGGNAYVTGWTGSYNFPLANPFQSTLGYKDAFLTKLNPDGSDLVYSTYLGGGNGEEGRDVAVDAQGNAYVVGYTSSSDFPTFDPIQPTLRGYSEAFVTKFDAKGTGLVYSTFLGGSSYDEAYAVAVDGAGRAYITGDTYSRDFPLATPLQATNSGHDLFISKLNSRGTAFVYSTYLGGNAWDTGYDIAADSEGNAYVTGSTSSVDFPLANPYQSSLHAYSDAFVSKLTANGSTLAYSTYLGGDDSDLGEAIAVDSAGSAYVTGDTRSANFPVIDAVQPSYGGIADAFVTKMQPSGSSLAYSTFLGGSNGDVGHDIALDGQGNAYVVGETYSDNFPTVDPYQPAHAGGYIDGFVAKISDLPPNSPTPTVTGTPPTATLTPTRTPVCRLDWQVASSPNPSDVNYLTDVAAVSINDVWAIGYYTAIMTNGSGLILHWDGLDWTQVPSPVPAFLYGISVVSSDDIWAVGSYGGPAVTLHWNGVQWSSVPNSVEGVLYAVSAISTNDVWAVGTQGSSGNEALIIHWNGVSWSRATTPTYSYSPLYSVEAISANDIWALGVQSTGDFFLHWDGAQWTQHTNQTRLPYRFADMSAISANDIWAVGTDYDRALSAHWNGVAWTLIPITSNSNSNAALTGVEALALDNVWAVGWEESSSYIGQRAMIQRWDGTQWRRVLFQNPNQPSSFEGVSGVVPNDIWAVGSSGSNYSYSVRTLTVRYDDPCTTPTPTVTGTPPTTVPPTITPTRTYTRTPTSTRTPSNTPTPTATPACVVTRFSSDVPKLICATCNVASTLTITDGPVISSIKVVDINIEHSWSDDLSVYLVSPTGTRVELFSYICGAGTWTSENTGFSLWDGAYSPIGYDCPPEQYTYRPADALSVLRGQSSSGTWTLEVTDNGVYWDGYLNAWGLRIENTLPCGTGTVTATSTGAPTLTPISTPCTGCSTSIPTAPVARTRTVVSTSTSSPVPCALQFSDVPSTNTFYANIRCLACRGIMGGYSDGTFRPNNDITRGQLSKIVANSAGFSNTPTAQTFEDVPSTSAFYVFIERIAGRGIIGGYTCGGAGEPCGVGNRPYFRPNAQATRGQISKIVSQSAGLSNPVSGQQFEDVPPGSTFYEWVQRLAGLGVMGGYPCGGAGEPCEVGNRPYFRPNNNATRGQVSKIVANTFFPNCTP